MLYRLLQMVNLVDPNESNRQSQVRRGYHHLVSKCETLCFSCCSAYFLTDSFPDYVNSRLRGGTRDAVYLFGDGEGARSAIAVARIVANVSSKAIFQT